mgnify:CR=1 FL=1
MKFIHNKNKMVILRWIDLRIAKSLKLKWQRHSVPKIHSICPCGGRKKKKNVANRPWNYEPLKRNGNDTSFLKLILNDHRGDHENVADAAADSHRRQQKKPRHSGPRWRQGDRRDIKVTVLNHSHFRLEPHNPGQSARCTCVACRRVHPETEEETHDRLAKCRVEKLGAGFYACQTREVSLHVTTGRAACKAAKTGTGEAVKLKSYGTYFLIKEKDSRTKEGGGEGKGWTSTSETATSV